MPYPASRTEPVVDVVHGVPVPDPYRWLEDGSSAEVRDWTAAQNAHTQAALAAFPGARALRARLARLLEVGSVGTPAPVRGRYFHTRREGTQNQPVLSVREGRDGPDRVLLDPGALAADGTVALDWWFPSRDGRLLAYGLSQGGSEKSTLRVREVGTGRDLPDAIDRTRACAVAWLPDGAGFYYTRYPAPGAVPAGEEDYHRRVYFHAPGADPEADPEVFGAGRSKEDWPAGRLSPDGRWLVVTVSQGWSRSEVYFQDRLKGGPFVPLAAGPDALFSVIPRADRFYVHTNDGALRYRLFAVDPLRPQRAAWDEIIPEGPDVLEGPVVVGADLVALYSADASSRLRRFTLKGEPRGEIPLPGLGTVAGLGAEWDGRELFFGFQSVTVPPSVYRLDLDHLAPDGLAPDGLAPDGGGVSLWAQVATEVDLDAYTLEQHFYPSRDGTRVSVFLAHRKGLARDGGNPTILYGYGGFNISLTPSFSSSRFAFLERGGVLAVANLRGGGEYGEDWHRAGMLGQKQNVFDDFLAAADWLVAEKITSPGRLAAMGGSNGGLLVGAALTQRPEAFAAVVCQVPLLDMVRYHRFLIARLWIPEYGSSDDPEQFRWLWGYSPYHRVRPGTRYPAVLLATAESDTRVDALHARKMTAALQAATAGGPVLLRLEERAGHGAGKPRGKVVEELTDVYSFVFAQLGMEA